MFKVLFQAGKKCCRKRPKKTTAVNTKDASLQGRLNFFMTIHMIDIRSVSETFNAEAMIFVGTDGTLPPLSAPPSKQNFNLDT